MELVTNATCPGVGKPCGAPTPDYDASAESVPLCTKCKADDWLYWNPAPKKRKKRR